MKVELILPIARLRGKLNGKSPFYFKTVNGKTYCQVLTNRDWMYITEVMDFSEYVGYDLSNSQFTIHNVQGVL